MIKDVTNEEKATHEFEGEWLSLHS
jgi:hypothetical protein